MGLCDFTFIKVVGRGSFGKVMLVKRNGSEEPFAMKILNKKMLERRNQKVHTKSNLCLTLAEREVLAKVDSEFIVKLHYAFQTDAKLYLVMEYLPGGELFYHLRKARRFTEEVTAFYAGEIILALECLHKNNIIYRDLKPENILFDEEGHIKITDFGLSKEGVAFGDQKTYSFCGTYEYLAPEIVMKVGHDKAVDWWSLVIIMLSLGCIDV